MNGKYVYYTKQDFYEGIFNMLIAALSVLYLIGAISDCADDKSCDVEIAVKLLEALGVKVEHVEEPQEGAE